LSETGEGEEEGREGAEEKILLPAEEALPELNLLARIRGSFEPQI